MNFRARFIHLANRAAPGAASILARACDRVLDWIADALVWMPTRFSPPPLALLDANEIKTARGRARVALDPASVFVTRLTLRRRDPFEAHAAFDLQASRHSPLPYDELEAGLALGEDGVWHAAMVTKADLDTLRAQAQPGTVDHFVHAQEGVQPFIIRGSAERAVRRSHDGALLAGVVLLALSALLAGSALRNHSARALDAEQSARSELVVAVRELSDELDAYAAAPVTGAPLSILIEALDATGQARPEGWALASWRFEDSAIVAQFEFAPSAAGFADALSQSLASSGAVNTVTTNTIPSRTALARLELRAQIVGDQP